ncbi:hypothetical protein PUNSTDRAFT_82541 [Punctularia strigosozonata HHB-11173 SS5]|uniref:uncharacterized protein n=1 Tax=Punctularia strigosozonata (strain HHB-11173) TaxID=741275 RepID=UPI0004416262|nr:uncharacterized protein PUNSTDRAFT_82541 [Punctularia strigosozonata HHB-11173 SS5]EIN13012.1 hypothetical protein PUNSTDRAFT_82541 [Punctularia strigosozonata HHB-11173 SS5]
MADTSQCFNCRKESMTKDLKRCARCRGALYCNADCQKNDWSNHKELCGESSSWMDKYRGCRDGSLHEGKLELMTWEYIEPTTKERMGWGNVVIEGAEYMKKVLREECNGKLSRLFKKRPEAFRWTCCGTDAGMNFGCDHHGTGSRPCTCDFCRMGKALPNKMSKV